MIRLGQLAFTPIQYGASLTRGGLIPHLLRKQEVDHLTNGGIHASSRWFEPHKSGKKLRDEYWAEHGSTVIQMELTQSGSFSQFEAPMDLFINWQASNLQAVNDASRQSSDMRLYIAQASLASLPKALQEDVRTPDMVANADVYGSSLWLGIPPTQTPLHKDPNDNLFVQLSGTKMFRLLKPEDGTRLLGHRRARMPEEMMMSEASKAVEELLWTKEHDATVSQADTLDCFTAQVEEGQGLFIPRGWWHSVRGVGDGINASVSDMSYCTCEIAN
jgi:Cupin-like domain